MSRDEDELNDVLGITPRVPGEDPRWDGDPHGVQVIDNGAFAEIENVFDDLADPLEVDENPYLTGVTDGDGAPGFRPFVEHSNKFTQAEDISDADHLDGLTDRDELNARQIDSNEENVLGDDFKERQQQLADAAVGNDGSAVGDLAQLAGVQQAQQQAATNVAPFTNINPPSAFRALLGGTMAISPGQAPTQLINWVGDDVEGKPVTISWTPDYSLAGSQLKKVNPFLIIKWGTRDGNQTVVVDARNGGQLTVCGSVVYVYVALDQAGGGDISEVGYTLSASLGYYQTQKSLPNTFTIIVPSGTGFRGAIVPAFAQNVMYLKTDQTKDVTLTFTSIDGVTLAVYDVPANTQLTNPLPIPNRTDVIILNSGFGGEVAGAIIYGLLL